MRMRDFRGIFCDGRVKMSVFDIFLSKKACFFKRIDKAYAWLILGLSPEYIGNICGFNPFFCRFGVFLEFRFIYSNIVLFLLKKNPIIYSNYIHPTTPKNIIHNFGI